MITKKTFAGHDRPEHRADLDVRGARPLKSWLQPQAASVDEAEQHGREDELGREPSARQSAS